MYFLNSSTISTHIFIERKYKYEMRVESYNEYMIKRCMFSITHTF
jgi:hypothetical protein